MPSDSPLPPPLPPRMPPPPPFFRPGPYVVEPHSSGNRRILLAVVVLALVIVVPLGWIAYKSFYIPRLDPRVEPSLAEKHREVAEAFTGRPIGPGAPEYGPIKKLFNDFQTAMGQKSTVALDPLCDPQRLFQEIERQDALGDLNYQQRRAQINFLRGDFPVVLMKSVDTYTWSRYQIRRIQLTDGGDEALVYVLAHLPNDTTKATRWWLHKSGGRWRIYDLEAIDLADRCSSRYVAIHTGSILASANWLQSFLNSRGAVAAMDAGNLKKAEQLLHQLDDVILPAYFDRWRWMHWAELHRQQRNYQAALADCDKAQAVDPDLPELDLIRAGCYIDLKKFDQAALFAQRFEAEVGEDRVGDEQLAFALLSLKKFPEAAALYRRVLDANPDEALSLRQLARMLAAKQVPALEGDAVLEFTDRFQKATKPHQLFIESASKLNYGLDLAALDPIIQAYRRSGADEPLLHYYDAKVKMEQKQYKEAAAISKELQGHGADAKETAEFLTSYINAAVLADETAEAYQLIPDHRLAFKRMVSQMIWRKKLPQMQQLIDLHRVHYDDDMWLHYYQAQLDKQLGKPEEAEQEYARAAALAAAATAQTPGEDARQDEQTIRYARVSAWCEAGKGLAAYAQIGPKKATFNQVAWHFRWKSDADDLDKLVQARRADDAKDVDLPLWEAEVYYERKEYTAAADLLLQQKRANAAAFADDEDEGDMSAWEDRLLRSLLRSGRSREALAEASVVAEKEKDLRYKAMALASSGNFAGAEEALNQCVAQGWSVAFLNKDEDLGPIIKGPAFAAWRLRNPEPTTRPATLPSE